MQLLDRDIDSITTCLDGTIFFVPSEEYGRAVKQMAEMVCMKEVKWHILDLTIPMETVEHIVRAIASTPSANTVVTEAWWLVYNTRPSED